MAALRLVPGIEVGEVAGLVWLRGKPGDEHLDAKLAALPARGRYEWIAPNQLRHINQRIPSMHLPEIRWQPLQTWLQVEMAVAATPANVPHRVPLILVRSVAEREPGLLMTNLDEVKRFAAAAARVRLEPLQLAVNAVGEVLVRGMPMPPLPGRRFVLQGASRCPLVFRGCRRWLPTCWLNPSASRATSS